MAHSLKDHPWQVRYCSSALNDQGLPTDVLRDFYLPALERSASYDRVAGYFRASSLAAAEAGYRAFLENGGRMRLIVGADLQLQDAEALLAGERLRLPEALMEGVRDPRSWPEQARSGAALLRAMAASGRLEVRVAVRSGPPRDAAREGYVHEKWFILGDGQGNFLCGDGSLNESRTALACNAENVSVSCSWEGGREAERVERARRDFEALWLGQVPHMLVLPLSQAIGRGLVRFKDPAERPREAAGDLLPWAPEPSLEELLRFAVLRDAPVLPGGQYLGMYTAPARPWPHQEAVARRLVETWPYSYLLCDEVGLGKTVEAALALRSLILCGRVRRVLIAAPAGLTGQWQRELAQKALLPFVRSRPRPGGGGAVQHAALLPAEGEALDKDLFGPAMNIVSTGLISRRGRQAALAGAEGYDVVLVDEAHYARRRNPQEGSAGIPDFGRLYGVLEKVLRPKAKSLWLATATPMQIDPVEVYDLFRLTGRAGPYGEDPALSEEYFRLLRSIMLDQPVDEAAWQMLGRSWRQLEMLDPFLWEQLHQALVTGKNQKALKDLARRAPKKADVRYLKKPLFAASPLSRVMLRHTRRLLELYRDQGELEGALARRHILPLCAVRFTPKEQAFYEMLSDYCDELGRRVPRDSQGGRQAMAFYLSFLQLRFASSVHAAQRTLERRLLKVRQTLLAGAAGDPEELEEVLEGILAGTALAEGDCQEEDLRDAELDALLKDRSRKDLRWEEERLVRMLAFLDGMDELPSKIQALLRELDQRRAPDGRLRQTVLFTRFTDSLSSIRGHLQTQSSRLRVGVYSGSGASRFDPEAGRDVPAGPGEVRDLFLQGQIDLLLCTDAAAEGLNLQTADLLINFDLGWNPVKVEQRIGRIDRIGQAHADIFVLNMCYLGSAEQTVYGRLFQRLRDAGPVMGVQQVSMLPVGPEDFRRLQSGELAPEELQRRAEEDLSRQRRAAAAMEPSPRDQYELCRRVNAGAELQRGPASLEDLWSALLRSPWLQSRGAFLDSGDVWRLPGGGGLPEVRGAVHRDGPDLLTWGDPGLDALLDALAARLPRDGPVRRLTASAGGITLAGYAAAREGGGVALITAFCQLEGLRIDPGAVLSEEDLRAPQAQLQALADQEQEKLRRAERAQEQNRAAAGLQKRLAAAAAAALLREARDGSALRQAGEGGLRYALLPAEAFSGKSAQCLFPLAEMNGRVSVPVQGALARCAAGAARRAAASVRASGGRPTAESVIAALERLE